MKLPLYLNTKSMHKTTTTKKQVLYVRADCFDSVVFLSHYDF